MAELLFETVFHSYQVVDILGEGGSGDAGGRGRMVPGQRGGRRKQLPTGLGETDRGDSVECVPEGIEEGIDRYIS